MSQNPMQSHLYSSPDDYYLKNSDAKKNIDMGPKWTQIELEIFLKHFKKNGLNDPDSLLKELKEEGYIRTMKNLQSIYAKNKNFLMKNCTAADLFAVMEDQYEELEQNQKIAETENILSNKRKINYIGPKISHFDDGYQKRIAYEQNSSYANIELTNKARRKSIPPKVKALKTSDLSNPNQIFKIIENQARICNGKSPKRSFRKVDDILSQSTIKFIENEYFYCYIDNIYFSYNEFKELLAQVNLPTSLNKSDWLIIRLSQSKPRRFSKKFLYSELEKLNNFRFLLRNFLHENISFNELESKIQNPILLDKIKKMNPLTVGQIVLALHPICQHFHYGAVLTANIEHNIIKFFTNELGVHKIKDLKISADYCQNKEDDTIETHSQSNISILQNKNVYHEQATENAASVSANEEGIVQEIDFFSMAFLLKLLDRKTSLITELRSNNNKYEKSMGVEMSEAFYQEYGWIGVQINLIDSVLKHVCAKFRLRGLNNYSKDDLKQISDNFEKILSNPLKGFLDKESENINNLDENTQETILKLKSVVNVVIEEKIERKIHNLIEEYEKDKNQKENNQMKVEEPNFLSEKHDHPENDMNEDKTIDLKFIVQNCLGVLLSLKQTGDIKLTENRFIKNISNSISEKNTQQFHEINNILLNLSIKHKN